MTAQDMEKGFIHNKKSLAQVKFKSIHSIVATKGIRPND